jgi:hypothetical protein
MSRFFVPCTEEQLAERIWKAGLRSELIEGLDAETSEPKSYAKKITGYARGRTMRLSFLTSTIEKDLKVEFDEENSHVDGFHTLDNGMTYLGVSAGGDWEVAIFYIIYWDGKKLRAYIPTDGNPWNTDLKSAYGNNGGLFDPNNEDQDLINAQKRFGNQITDAEGENGYKNLAADMPKILADIKQRILPISKPDVPVVPTPGPEDEWV